MATGNGRRTVLLVTGLSAVLGLVVLVASWYAVDTERELRATRTALVEWAREELPARGEGWTDDAEFEALARRAEDRGYVLHRAPTGETLVVELREVGFFRVHAEQRDGRAVTALSPVARPEWIDATPQPTREGN